MNLKEAIFGGGPRSVAGSDSVYRDSIQAWLPVKNIIGGVVVTTRVLMSFAKPTVMVNNIAVNRISFFIFYCVLV